jgi:Phage tail protein.
MSFALPNGARVYVQKAKGITYNFETISNAKEAVIVLKTGHGIVVGDEVIITSSWSKLNNVVAKVVRVNNTEVTLGSINTTNTNIFPAGEGKGTITERQLPTIKSAKSKNYIIAHDSSLAIYALLQELDQTNDIVAMKMYVPKAKETRYDSVRISFDPTPETAVNDIETVKISATVESPAITFYKSKETEN